MYHKAKTCLFWSRHKFRHYIEGQIRVVSTKFASSQRSISGSVKYLPVASVDDIETSNVS